MKPVFMKLAVAESRKMAWPLTVWSAMAVVMKATTVVHDVALAKRLTDGVMLTTMLSMNTWRNVARMAEFVHDDRRGQTTIAIDNDRRRSETVNGAVPRR